MKSASADLINHLNNHQEYIMVDLLTFTLLDGTNYRYALWDLNLTYNGITFNKAGDGTNPLFERSRVRTILGVEVDTLDLKIYAKSSDMLGTISWIQSAAKGVLDGAMVLLERVFLSDNTIVIGGYVNFSGRVADITMSRNEIDLVVKSDIELLNIQMPRNLYQAGCPHNLYDADCQASRISFRTSGIVNANSTASLVLCNVTSKADGYFDMGYIEFTSGALVGIKRTVKAYTNGSLSLMNPLPQVPSSGDSFYVYAGCDKQQSTCKNKFNNLAHFRGFPYVPVPETTR